MMISVIVVHYGARKEVFKCLDTLNEIRLRQKSVEFIFVDNEGAGAVSNKVQKKYPWVKYIKAPSNLGFGGGRNLGRSFAKGEYLFCLDADITIDYKSFKKLVNFLDSHKDAGFVAPGMQNLSGKFTPQITSELTPIRGIFYLSFINKIFPNNPFSKSFLLSNQDRNNTCEVECPQIGGFMVRTKVFDMVGGFDENLFLYFEENDFPRRIKNEGWNVYFLPEARIIHLESKGTPKSSERIKNIFAHSRFYYFNKHYGLLPAIVVELFARFSKEIFILLIILAIGTFLRFYKLSHNLIFNGEMGTDYLNVLNIIHGTRTFLIGPRTSHEWFFIPPVSYWLYAVLLSFSKFNPIIVNYFWAVVSSIGILVCYFYVKKLFDGKVALVSSFFLAISPGWLDYARASRYNAPVALLFFPYLWYLKKSIEDNGKSLFALGLILGFSMNFFPSPLLLIPAVVVSFIFYRVKPKLKYVGKFILGFLIPNFTFLIYEILNKFQITVSLISWIPYRVAGFFGLYHKNTVSTNIIYQNLISIYKFISEEFFVNFSVGTYIIFGLVVIGSIILSVKLFKDRQREKPFFLLIVNLLICYLGLFIHGNPPIHYYLIIYPIPLILLSLILFKTIQSKPLIVLSVLFLGVSSIYTLIVSNWFDRINMSSGYADSPVPYLLQLDVVNEITKNSLSQCFEIGRIGYNDNFENNFANNYIYLLTTRGACVNLNANIKYTISEIAGKTNLPLKNMIWTKGGVSIYKSQK
jgi:GT2 family glycosyltransferase/4-amino-4-deoxy-L-arabinose transferase-like glycosyltransferase